METLDALQVQFTVWLQTHAGPGLPFMRAVSNLGRGTVYFTLGALVWWAGRRRLGYRLLGLLTLSGMLNTLLKTAIHAPRPYWVHPEILGHAFHTSYGMPSGHAQSAAVFAGALAASAGKAWAWAVAGTWIFFVGLSRVFLGVHSPAQVFAGWTIGLLLVSAWMRAERPVAEQVSRRPAWQPALVVSALVALAWAAGLALKASLAGFRVPEAWLARMGRPFPKDPFPLYHLAQASGAFLGLSVGGLLGRNLPEEPARRLGDLWRLLAGLAILSAWGLVGLGLHLRAAHPAIPFSYSLTSGLLVSAAVPWITSHFGFRGPRAGVKQSMP